MGFLNRQYTEKQQTPATAHTEHAEEGHAEHGEDGHGEGHADGAHDEHDADAGHEEHAAGGHDDGLWHKIIHTLSKAITWGGNMDGHLILYVFLPILIFEAGFALNVHTFKKSVGNAFYLAGPGIVTATLMTGLCFLGMVKTFGGDGGVLSEWNVEGVMSFVWLELLERCSKRI